MKRFNPAEIEPKWQKIWDDTEVYKADFTSDKPHYIAMSMFNYPSGNGIHIGHAMNYTISDVMARFKRQQGYESYHPVGWDAFGLPAENYAIKTGVSPQESMANIIPMYHKQYRAMGWSNDWSKEISTHLPEYYKWTQWIFSEMFRQGLAYQDARMQWWCEQCQTVLANEQVIDGKCWRHDSADDPEVNKKEVKQWFFKITDYADEMLEATYGLDWSDVVKTAQINWIGKSKGAEVIFEVASQVTTSLTAPDSTSSTESYSSSSASPSPSTASGDQPQEHKITVFTTRPDTLYGATFMVLAPEHDLVSQIVSNEKRAEVNAYVKETMKKSELERQENKEKTGIFTGAYAVNPLTDEQIPIWVADYVLVGYGTGAIMAVPAHDERDAEFAKKFDLPIKQVVASDQVDTEFPPRPGSEIIEREAVQMIVKHPSDETYLLLKMKGWDREAYSFVTGGLDGEIVDVAARRELLEETGYNDIETVTELPNVYFATFYHEHKKVNRHVQMHTVVTKLKSLAQDSISEEEKALNEPMWLTASEVATRLSGSKPKQIFDDYLSGAPGDHEDGVLVNSGPWTGLQSAEAREQIVQHLEREGKAKEKVNYRIRDWSVSRQRYWGAPIPIVNCPEHGAVLVADEQLPVVLPELDDYAPSGDGRSALARATEWLKTTCPVCGGPAERETDTLDTYICSSWYELRYFDPKNAEKAFEPKVANTWMPIDFYNGGDHATAHLIYVRFIARFFHKLGMLDDPEPFKRFLFNGKVTASDGTMFSKSKGNGVDPLEIINQGYGADALRTYLMFAAPLDLWIRWDPQGVPGTHRFLSRVWTVVQEFLEAKPTEGDSEAVLRVIHPTIKKVTDDLESQKYNTAIAAMMKATNELYEIKAKNGFAGHDAWQFALESLVSLVGPFAPHMADELWQQLGRTTSIQRNSWPEWNDKYLVSDTVTVVLQVNGKVRAQVEVPAGSSKEELETLALENDRIKEFMGDKKPARVIVVPGRLVNIVA